jgi:Uncharacterized conserved protein
LSQDTKGSYVLLIELAVSKDILVGKLGYISFPKAFYAYVGSAMNGFKARLPRHLRREKKLHWHIDYLLQEARIADIILCPGEQRTECLIAQAMAEEFASISDFGCSDCCCGSHLYYDKDKNKLKAGIVAACESIYCERSEAIPSPVGC